MMDYITTGRFSGTILQHVQDYIQNYETTGRYRTVTNYHENFACDINNEGVPKRALFVWFYINGTIQLQNAT